MVRPYRRGVLDPLQEGDEVGQEALEVEEQFGMLGVVGDVGCRDQPVGIVADHERVESKSMVGPLGICVTWVFAMRLIAPQR